MRNAPLELHCQYQKTSFNQNLSSIAHHLRETGYQRRIPKSYNLQQLKWFLLYRTVRGTLGSPNQQNRVYHFLLMVKTMEYRNQQIPEYQKEVCCGDPKLRFCVIGNYSGYSVPRSSLLPRKKACKIIHILVNYSEDLRALLDRTLQIQQTLQIFLTSRWYLTSFERNKIATTLRLS